MFCKTIAIAALPAGLAFCTNSTSPDGVRTDHFDVGALSNYSAYADIDANPWAVASGTLQGNGVAQQSVLIRKSDQLTNGWVEITADSIDDGGIALRFSDNEHYWLLAVRDDQSQPPRNTDNLQIYRRGGAGQAGFVSVWRKDIVWPRGTPHRVRFEAEGDTLRAYLDDVITGEVVQPASQITGRGFGVRHYGATTSWISRYRLLRWYVEESR